jgi:hypothetical protein
MCSINRVQSLQTRLPAFLFFALALFLFHPGVVLGQSGETKPADETETESAGASTAPEPSEVPPPPGLPKDSDSWDVPSKDASTWDWVLLTSGEWLKGTIELMRDYEMEFDSDELGILKLEMEDVAGFYANRTHTYLFEHGVTVTGRGVLRGEELVVEGKKYDREPLMAIIKGKEEESNYWSGKLNLGLTLIMGNTEQATLTSSGYIRRESAKSRLKLEHTGTFGSVSREVNVQKLTSLAQLDIFLSKRWYIIPTWAIATHDRFQNINVRVIPGAGAGVHLFKTKVVEWDINAGLGYQFQEYRSVEAGQDQTLHDGVVGVSTQLELDLGKLVDFELTWWSIFAYTDWGTTSHHGTAMLEFEVTDIFDLTISAIYDRVEKPVADENGDVPESDDLQLTVGMMVEF